jgi:hypothetical protein
VHRDCHGGMKVPRNGHNTNFVLIIRDYFQNNNTNGDIEFYALYLDPDDVDNLPSTGNGIPQGDWLWNRC